ncbi:Rhodanese-like domain-containing protein [Polychytrium aggregatum]|uniref:Rhodanese-like domain-containing protein n=1 Tax=Polychytrium aggregatum TaxID=110093 RepID=UPI0022FDF519|nr:Rhodanese-like domain-containing protein [Polychytrium aggregatum]KAI9205410.1 Rhodanese-like domain-containing protein [Polychytrium aggregatum]
MLRVAFVRSIADRSLKTILQPPAARKLTSSMSAPQYIDASELVKDIRNPALRSGVDYLVVDVRDEDFKFGNIPNALNVPAHEFLETVPSQIERLNSAKKLVFHCALSQVRGPKCAGRYRTALNAAVQEGTAKEQEVVILRGGFENWVHQHQKEPDLVENYNAKYWADPY